MSGRRTTTVVVLLLAVGIVASMLASSGRNGTPATTATGPLTSADTPTALAPTATAPAIPARVTATMPQAGGEPRTVRATVGQAIALTVDAEEPDSVSIPGLDRIEQAQPGTPARFSLLVTRPGRYPVLLQRERRKVGELHVAAKRPR